MPEQTLPEKTRIISIDAVRGLVMVVMALDHVRDFFHSSAFAFDPTAMDKTNPALFFTRWITHFCAPAFMFLAGASIYLSRQHKTKKDLSVFLVTRGLWLIGIIGMIGACMVIMAPLVFLADQVLLALGVIMILGFNLIPPGQNSSFGIWELLMRSGFFSLSADRGLIAPYPLVPWSSVMVLGYSTGKLYDRSFTSQQRRRILFWLGLLSAALFVVLRLINGYGDPAPWSNQKSFLFTFMSFLNVTKYPVSLQFTLMTLGPLLMILSGWERAEAKALKPVLVYGRVPLFYFILHFYLIHSIALLFFLNKTGKSFAEIDLHFAKSFGGITPEGGYSLPWVYVAWIFVVLMMYPLCKAYGHYKQTHHYKWLSYL